MINLTWEQIEHDHSCHIFRARIPGGWLVRCDEIRYKNLGSRITEEASSDWRSAITFVPDPEHRWASTENPPDPSTTSTPSTPSTKEP